MSLLPPVFLTVIPCFFEEGTEPGNEPPIGLLASPRLIRGQPYLSIQARFFSSVIFFIRTYDLPAVFLSIYVFICPSGNATFMNTSKYKTFLRARMSSVLILQTLTLKEEVQDSRHFLVINLLDRALLSNRTDSYISNLPRV